MVFEVGGAGDAFGAVGTDVVIAVGVTGVVFKVGVTAELIEVTDAVVTSVSGSTSGIAGSIRLSATVAEVTNIGPSTTSSSSTLGSYTVLVRVRVLPSGVLVVMIC